MEYRLYDLIEKEYINEPDYKWLVSKSGKIYSSELDEYLVNGVEILIERFTGLIDKNKEKIFEGDIVTHKFKRPWQTETHTSTVVWDGEWMCYYLYDGTSNYRMRSDIEYEVIGDIHDN